MNKPTLSFTNSDKSKAKKKWNCIVSEDTTLDGCSKALQAMCESAVDLWIGFTLEELARNAVDKWELETKSTDMHALGYTHRPKLLELGVIAEASDSDLENDYSDVEEDV